MRESSQVVLIRKPFFKQTLACPGHFRGGALRAVSRCGEGPSDQPIHPSTQRKATPGRDRRSVSRAASKGPFPGGLPGEGGPCFRSPGQARQVLKTSKREKEYLPQEGPALLPFVLPPLSASESQNPHKQPLYLQPWMDERLPCSHVASPTA